MTPRDEPPALPPPEAISPELRTALDAVAEGGDHNETAFALLIEDVRSWSALPEQSAAPNWRGLLEGGDSVRGALLLVRGRLAQRSELEERWPGVEEWFLRDGTGEAICAFVVDPPPGVRDGATVTLAARWYKRVDFVARDGELRGYPAVVGRVASNGTTGVAPNPGVFSSFGLLTALILAMAVFYVILRVRAGRTGRRPWRDAARRGAPRGR